MSKELKEIAKMIDHSLLHPTMTDRELMDGCRLALRYDVASVCIKPYAVPLAAEELKGSDVMVGTVIGFPHGNSSIRIKRAETEQACRDGAVEIDMVVNIGKVLGGEWDYISEEMEAVLSGAARWNASVKVIFENDYLKEEHIRKLCGICNVRKPAFVKTSTGYGFVKQENGMYSYRGATAEHLKIMRRETDPTIGVKAAGGIRTLDDLLFVRSLGVGRVGATATAVILDEAAARHRRRISL